MCFGGGPVTAAPTDKPGHEGTYTPLPVSGVSVEFKFETIMASLRDCTVQCIAPCVSMCMLTELHQRCMSDCMTDSTTAACAAVAGLVRNTILSAATCMKPSVCWNVV